MADQSKQIQWFPGHMAKARRQMEENLKKVDMIIEIRDARIPESSRNPMLEELGPGKPRLIILSKTDKADAEATKKWVKALTKDSQTVLALDLLHQNFAQEIVKASRRLCQSLIEKQQRRGIRPRAIRAMVAGIPNVGKSTFINTLARRKAAKTGDKPGVTKSLQWISLAKDLDLLDTPGVLWPRFEDQNAGLRLALLGSIKDEVVDMERLAVYAIQWLTEHKRDELEAYYSIEAADTPHETLNRIAIKRGWLLKGEPDQERLVRSVVKDLRENRLGPVSWELPND